MSLFNSALFPPAPKHTDVVNRTHHPIHDVVAPDHLTAQPIHIPAQAMLTQQKTSANNTYLILGVALAVVLAYKMNR